VKCVSVLTEADLSDFIEMHPDVAARLVNHFIEGKKEEALPEMFSRIENEMREFALQISCNNMYKEISK